MRLKRRAAAAILLLSVAAVLSGCSKGDSGEASPDKTPEPEWAVFLDVDKGYFIDEATGKTDVEKYMGVPSNDTYDYEIGESGEVRLKFTQACYDDFDSRMRASVDKTFEELSGQIVSGSDAGYVKEVKPSKDYTRITVSVDPELYAGVEKDYVPGYVGMTACIYQAFTPEGLRGCEVSVLNGDTGKVMGIFRFPTD